MNEPNAPQTGTQDSSTERASERRPAHKGKLERPGIRRKLIRELAEAEVPQAALAQKYGCATSSLTEFKQRHQEEITAVAADLENEFAGLWIADKSTRLSELQELYEAAETGDLNVIKARVDVMRKAAEELGHIPNRTTINLEQPIRVEITGLEDI